MSNQPTVLQYVGFLSVVNSSSAFSFKPTKAVINNEDIWQMGKDDFVFNVEYFETYDTGDEYMVTSNDPEFIPFDNNTYLPPNSLTTTIRAQLTKVSFYWSGNSEAPVKLNKKEYNYGEVYYMVWYKEYLEKYIGQTRSIATVNQYMSQYEEQLVNTTKLQITRQYMNNLASDYGSGVCHGYICTPISIIFITSFLNSTTALSIVASVFMFFLKQHYMNYYRIDIDKIIEEKDKIDVKQYLPSNIVPVDNVEVIPEEGRL